MNPSNALSHDNTPTSSSASIALRRTSIPNITPLAITRPHREPLAILDPQSAHSRLSDDSNHSSSSMLAYSQQQSDPKDRDYNLDFSSYRIGRQIINRSTLGDEDLNHESAITSRKPSITQLPSTCRHTPLRPMPSPASSVRRASVPTLHFRPPSSSFGTDSTSNLPMPNSAYISTDELYSGLNSFTFGAARGTRSSTPDSELLDPFPSRVADQRPRRSLSAVSTPRDDEFEDEADSARNSRAKMRAIDDGSRRPSLPKNTSSQSPLRHHMHNQSSMDTDRGNSMDIDRSSTYTFGFAGIYHDYTSQHSVGSEEEHPDEVSSSPVVFARHRQLFADDEEEEEMPYVVPMANNERRGSFPIDIPTPSISANSDSSIRTRRKMSRSMDDDLGAVSHGAGGIGDIGSNAHSEPLTRGEWSSFEQQYQQRRRSLAPSVPDEANPYEGLNLAYIFGANANSTAPRKSWSSGGSFVQHQPALNSPLTFQTSFGGLRFIGGGLDSRRPSAATIGEDPFLKHLRVNDANYEMRLGEWTFGREKADGLGPNANIVAGGSKDVASANTVAPGAHEIWRCKVVGRFTFERLVVPPEPGSAKSPQHRLNVKHIPDPFSNNTRGGPSVVVHKHSRATAFSVFRSHYLFKPRQNGKSNGRADTSHSILLATKKVQEMYTSTKTTNKLKTHGLLEESPKQESRNSDTTSRRSEARPTTLPRTPSLSRKENDKKEKAKERDKKKDRAKEKDKGKDKSRDTGVSSQTTSRDSAISKSDSFVSNWTRHLSGRHVSPPLPPVPSPPSTTPSASTSPQSASTHTVADSITWNTSHSTLESVGPSRSHHPVLRQSSSGLTLRDADDEEEEDDYIDQYHQPVQRRSHAETYDSLTPMHHEHARHLLRSNVHAGSTSRPRFRRIFPKKGNMSEWPPSSPTTSIAPSPVPWMLTNNSEKLEGQVVMTNLNDNFGAVGLVPPRQPNRPNRPRRPGGDQNMLLQVPEDSLYMVLPLFVGETEPTFAPDHPDATHEVPLEERKYLLVYYVPFDSRSTRPMAGGTKRAEFSGVTTGQDHNRSKSVFLSSFRVSAHLMSYNDFRGTNVRLPSLGLSVTGPLSKATPPEVVPIHMDAIAIAQCSRRESGIEFLPEGLVKLGLCHAEEVQPMSLDEDSDSGDEEVEFRFELSAIGRAVVEMAWVGAMAVTSFGSV